MLTRSQPQDSLQPFIELAQEMREASANRDYAALGRLLTENLNPDMANVMLYIHSPLGHLTIIGGYTQLWSQSAPEVLAREPTLTEMAVVLRAAWRS
jgi:hypothetical protein